ncbi:MAG TPA: EI24 domain-containing protein [Roseomonas sp.]|jgi:uncharacterized protein involved in cysteine biosynthesis
MTRAIWLAFDQLGDPAFRRPILLGAIGAIAALLLLATGAGYGIGWALGGLPHWLVGIAQALGSLLTLGLAWWLFLPLALAIGGAFLDAVAAAVEARHYPDLPPAQGAGLAAQGWWNVKFALGMLALQLLLLPLVLFLPVIGAAIALAIAAHAMGVGLFEGVAQRRMGIDAARAARRARRWRVWLLGLALAAIAAVPFVNLLVPVLGTAAAVHLLQARQAGT